MKQENLHLKRRFEIGCIVADLLEPVPKALVAPDSADMLLRFESGLWKFGIHGCDSALCSLNGA